MSMKTLAQEIADGKVGAVTIDTNIFDGAKLGFEYGLLKRMDQFCDTAVKFVLSDIVVRELLAHLERECTASEANLKQTLKSVGNYWQVSKEYRDNALNSLFQGKTPEQIARERLSRYITETECEIIESAEYVDIGELVKRYFSHSPPFEEKEEKKHEFPDALALLSLESWAQRTDKKVVVVSNDGGWARYCATSGRLFLVKTLSEAFSLFHKEASVACAVISRKLRDGELAILTEAIKDKIDDHVSWIDYSPEYSSSFFVEGEVGEVEVDSFEFEELGRTGNIFRPIDSDEDTLTITATVVAEVNITGYFSFSVHDSIDKDYVPMGSSSSTETVRVEIDLIITLQGEEITKEFDIIEIEATSKDAHVDFGYVEPDWSDEYEEPEYEEDSDADEQGDPNDLISPSI